jgi:hypothetical protein
MEMPPFGGGQVKSSYILIEFITSFSWGKNNPLAPSRSFFTKIPSKNKR